jgi:hypothetical protein
MAAYRFSRAAAHAAQMPQQISFSRMIRIYGFEQIMSEIPPITGCAPMRLSRPPENELYFVNK